MNSLERIVSAVKFQQPDRVPVAPIVFGHSAVVSGIPLSEYLDSGEALARCQMNALERYGYDAVFAVMGGHVEDEALGVPLLQREGLYPWARSNMSPDDILELQVPDPLTAGRMPEVLKADGVLRREVGDHTLVVGLVVGPLSLAAELMGLKPTLLLAADDPKKLGAVLDFCVEVITAYGKAQIDAGAHLPLICEQAATPELVAPSFFRESIFPRLKQVFDAFIQAGAAANMLHISGKTDVILPLYPEAGVDVASIDYPVSMEGAQKAMPQTCLLGNIKPLSFVTAQPQEIEAEANRLIKTFEGRGGFILSSGMEVPLEAKPENLDALVSASKRYKARGMRAA